MLQLQTRSDRDSAHTRTANNTDQRTRAATERASARRTCRSARTFFSYALAARQRRWRAIRRRPSRRRRAGGAAEPSDDSRRAAAPPQPPGSPQCRSTPPRSCRQHWREQRAERGRHELGEDRAADRRGDARDLGADHGGGAGRPREPVQPQVETPGNVRDLQLPAARQPAATRGRAKSMRRNARRGEGERAPEAAMWQARARSMLLSMSVHVDASTDVVAAVSNHKRDAAQREEPSSRARKRPGVRDEPAAAASAAARAHALHI